MSKRHTGSTNKKNKVLVKESPRFSRKTKRYMIASFVIIVAILLVVLLWGNIRSFFSSSDTPLAPEVTVTSDSMQDAYDKAMTLASTGTEGVQEPLDRLLKSAKTDEERAHIYVLKAGAARAEKQPDDQDEAKRFALEAERLHPTVSSAMAVAAGYAAAQDNAQTITYYKLALERMGPYDQLSPLAKVDFDYIQTMIRELEG